MYRTSPVHICLPFIKCLAQTRDTKQSQRINSRNENSSTASFIINNMWMRGWEIKYYPSSSWATYLTKREKIKTWKIYIKEAGIIKYILYTRAEFLCFSIFHWDEFIFRYICWSICTNCTYTHMYMCGKQTIPSRDIPERTSQQKKKNINENPFSLFITHKYIEFIRKGPVSLHKISNYFCFMYENYMICRWIINAVRRVSCDCLYVYIYIYVYVVYNWTRHP